MIEKIFQEPVWGTEGKIRHAMTAATWRKALETDFSFNWFSFNGKEYYLESFSDGEIDIFCYEDQVTTECYSVEEAMTVPAFDGHSLEEIAEQLMPI